MCSIQKAVNEIVASKDLKNIIILKVMKLYNEDGCDVE